MNKILTVFWNEYRHIVFTKSFLLGLLIPVIMYGGMILVMAFAGGTTDLRDRKLLVVDYTDAIYPALETAVEERNRGDRVFDDKGKQVAPKFAIERVDPGGRSQAELELELSDRVRDEEAFAFGLIGPDYRSIEGGEGDFLAYYSNSPTFSSLPDWFRSAVRAEVEAQRFAEAGLDPRLVKRATSHNQLDRYNLAVESADGSVTKPKEENEIFSLILPMVAVMMLFFGVQWATPVLLNSVIEEKMQRIVEVILSSVSPMQLLTGKLLAGASIGMTFAVVYSATGVIGLYHFERGDYLAVTFLPYFYVFLLISLLTFGALLAGVSSVCQDLKDSQNMAGAVIMLLVIPMLLSFALINAPESALSQTLSFIPPLSPMLMTMRLAVPPGPEWWEPVLAVAINLVFAVVVVFASARIFRIGILAQGKTPTWREILRWAWKG